MVDKGGPTRPKQYRLHDATVAEMQNIARRKEYEEGRHWSEADVIRFAVRKLHLEMFPADPPEPAPAEGDGKKKKPRK